MCDFILVYSLYSRHLKLHLDIFNIFYLYIIISDISVSLLKKQFSKARQR